MDARPPLSTEPAFWYNNAAKSRWALVPGSITIVMTLIGTLLTSLVITREWERGTMEALFASPVSRLQILLSKLVPYYLLAMLSMMLCTLAGVWLFGVPAPWFGGCPRLADHGLSHACSGAGVIGFVPVSQPVARSHDGLSVRTHAFADPVRVAVRHSEHAQSDPVYHLSHSRPAISMFHCKPCF